MVNLLRILLIKIVRFFSGFKIPTIRIIQCIPQSYIKYQIESPAIISKRKFQRLQPNTIDNIGYDFPDSI